MSELLRTEADQRSKVDQRLKLTTGWRDSLLLQLVYREHVSRASVVVVPKDVYMLVTGPYMPDDDSQSQQDVKLDGHH